MTLEPRLNVYDLVGGTGALNAARLEVLFRDNFAIDG